MAGSNVLRKDNFKVQMPQIKRSSFHFHSRNPSQQNPTQGPPIPLIPPPSPSPLSNKKPRNSSTTAARPPPKPPSCPFCTLSPINPRRMYPDTVSRPEAETSKPALPPHLHNTLRLCRPQKNPLPCVRACRTTVSSLFRRQPRRGPIFRRASSYCGFGWVWGSTPLWRSGRS